MVNRQRQAVVDFFDRSYRWWEGVYASDLPQGFFSYQMIRRKAVVLDMLQQRCKASGSLKILDCGCGPGDLLEELPAEQRLTVGMDIHYRWLRKQRRHKADLSLVCGDVEQLPFRSDSFDVILCLGVLSYLDSCERALSELARLLKPGGCLITANPNLFMLDKLLDPYYLLVWPWTFLKKRLLPGAGRVGIFDQTSIRRFRYRHLLHSCRGAGLIALESVGVGYGPLRFWRKPLVNEDRAIRISERLSRNARHRWLRGLNRLANHWVTVLEKPGYPERHYS